MHLGPCAAPGPQEDRSSPYCSRAELRCLGNQDQTSQGGRPCALCSRPEGQSSPGGEGSGFREMLLAQTEGPGMGFLLRPSWWRAWSPWVPLPRREGPGTMWTSHCACSGPQDCRPGWGSVGEVGELRWESPQRRCCAGAAHMPVLRASFRAGSRKEAGGWNSAIAGELRGCGLGTRHLGHSLSASGSDERGLCRCQRGQSF